MLKGHRGKRERRGPMQVKQAKNFQGLEINYGKLLLVYFEVPQAFKHWVLWGPWGNFPLPPLGGPG